jgi:hypothetical protein
MGHQPDEFVKIDPINSINVLQYFAFSSEQLKICIGFGGAAMKIGSKEVTAAKSEWMGKRRRPRRKSSFFIVIIR